MGTGRGGQKNQRLEIQDLVKEFTEFANIGATDELLKLTEEEETCLESTARTLSELPVENLEENEISIARWNDKSHRTVMGFHGGAHDDCEVFLINLHDGGVLTCGTIDLIDTKKFLENFDMILALSDDKFPKSTKTPKYAQKVAQEAWKYRLKDSNPQFAPINWYDSETDAHGEVSAREVLTAVVTAIFNLINPAGDPRKVILNFMLHTLENYVAGCSGIESCGQVTLYLNCVADYAFKMSQSSNHLDLTAVAEHLQSVQSHLGSIYESHNEYMKEEYTIKESPHRVKVDSIPYTRSFHFNKPTLSEDSTSIRAEALLNLGSAPESEPQYKCISIERKLTNLLKQKEALTAADCSNVKLYVDEYETIVASYSKDPAMQYPLEELRSSRVIVVWMAYCILHKRALAVHPLTRSYGSPLNIQHLEALVVSDEYLRSSIEIMAQYLSKYTTDDDNKKLFHCNSGSMSPGTINFGSDFVLQSRELKTIYQNARSVLKSKQENLMRKVRKQDDEIDEIVDHIENLQEERHEAVTKNHRRRLDREIRGLESKKMDLRRVPETLSSSLPRDEFDAYSVIFYYNMPHELSDLADFSFKCYEVLSDKPRPTVQCSDWKDCYSHDMNSFGYGNRCSNPFTFSNSPPTLQMTSRRAGRPPQRVGPTDIYSLISQNDPNLVTFYPSDTPSIMSKSGSNPFGYDQSACMKHFTPILSDYTLQWAVDHPVLHQSESHRGNVPYRSTHVDGLSKMAAIDIGALRSFPYQQVRKTAAFLQTVLLGHSQLSNVDVQTILLQATNHVGEIDLQTGYVLWRQDYNRDDVVYKCIHDSLLGLANVIRTTPRHQKIFPVLARLASHFAQYEDTDQLPIAYSVIAEGWAQQAEKQTQKTILEKGMCSATTKMRCTEGKMLGLALMSLTLCKMTSELAERLLRLVTLHRWKSGREPNETETAATRAISRHFDGLMSHTLKEPKILTPLVKLVFNCLSEPVTWKKIAGKPAFETTSGSGDHYAINIFTGIVLKNANPPGLLPAVITSTKLYTRMFRSRNFEVSKAADGGFLTTHPMQGFVYEFTPLGDGEMRCRQRGEKDLFWRKLISISELTEQRIPKCPKRLVDLHSHWEEEVTGDLLFKSLQIEHLSETPTFKANQSGLYDGSDKFITIPEGIEPILNRIEKECFIHTLKKPDGKIIIKLPRYGLTLHLEESGIHMSNHRHYHLSKQQHVVDLPEFSTFLMLSSDPANVEVSETRLIIPCGEIDESGVILSDSASANIDYQIYDYRQGMPRAKTLSARLHLAAIYASFGIPLPVRTGYPTGPQYCIELLQRCCVDRPFSESELQQLDTVAASAWYTKNLIIKECSNLLRYSGSRHFLWSKTTDYPTELSQIMNNSVCKAVDEIRNEGRCYSLPLNQNGPKHIKFDLSIQRDAIEAKYLVQEMEQRFVQSFLVQDAPGASSSDQVFPFSDGDGFLEGELYSELKDSWNLFRETAQSKLETERLPGLIDYITRRQKGIETQMTKLLSKLTYNTHDVTCSRSTAYFLKYLAGYEPGYARSRFFKICYDDSDCHNPSTEAVILQQASQGYLELDVLHQKLRRIIFYWNTKNREKLRIELSSKRQWLTSEYPRWLTFEADAMLQVRDDQYKLAVHLLDESNSGSICQLNMGLGKTRVVIPLLIMGLIAKKKVPRVVLLRPLISEAIDYYGNALTDSTQLIRIYQNPFEREIQVPKGGFRKMIAANKKSSTDSVWVETPEHRLSLQLRMEEVRETDKTLSSLISKTIMENEVLILDESDALCHYKYHLIYTAGSQHPLPDLQLRVKVMQGVLRTFCSKQVNRHFHNPDFAVLSPFVRIVNSNHVNMKLLCSDIADDIISNPPPGMLWIRKSHYTELKYDIKSAVLHPDNPSALESKLDKVEWSQLMMLRGLLCHGLLAHCMMLRYQVEYGIAEGRKKRIAVPFRAAGIPHERSEFSHPDVLLMLSQLATYQRGLSELEIKEAVTQLLQLPISRQNDEYGRWLESSNIPENLQVEINNYQKLDSTNEMQLRSLHQVFTKCRSAIDFFLEVCVFPSDTVIFPSRLSKSAWDIVANKHVVGFSGTNEASCLLPLSIRQNEPNIPTVRGTNGMMLSKLMKCSAIHMLPNTTSLWKEVIDTAVFKNMDAIIDTGCLLAECDLKGCATYAMKALIKCRSMKQGVMAFTDDSWRVCNVHTERWALRSESPLADADCFILFDDARCRGSDMKMHPSAHAALTLGRNLTKDKLMQGAGRLRQFGADQHLTIVVPYEVSLQLPPNSTTTVKMVLQWVMNNTCNSITSGIVEWMESGYHHVSTQSDPKISLQHDNWDVNELYRSEYKEKPISELSRSGFESCFQHCKEQEVNLKVCKTLQQSCDRLGQGISRVISASDKMCEREMAVEEEQQKEVSRQGMAYAPCEERAWDYEQALVSLAALQTQTKITPLDTHWTPATSSIPWSKRAHIYATKNFDNALHHTETAKNIRAYLEYTNGIQIVVLSDREADGILSYVRPNQSVKFRFVHVSDNPRIDISTTISIWNGICLFPNKESHKCITELLESPNARHSIVGLVSMRGTISHFEGSHLQKAVQQVLLN